MKEGEAEKLESRLLLLKVELDKSSRQIDTIKNRRIEVEQHRDRLHAKYTARLSKIEHQAAVEQLVHEYYIARKESIIEKRNVRQDAILRERSVNAQAIKDEQNKLRQAIKTDKEERFERARTIHTHVKTTLAIGKQLRLESLQHKKAAARQAYAEQHRAEQQQASEADLKIRVLEQAEREMINLLQQARQLQLDEYSQLQQTINGNTDALKQHEQTLKQTQLLLRPPTQSNKSTPKYSTPAADIATVE